MWLVNNLGLSKVPRLITPQIDPKPQPTKTLEILREDGTDEITKSSKRIRKSKIVYAKGEEVAFRTKTPGMTDERDWILGKVVRVIGEGKSRRYDVQDLEDESSTNLSYKSSALQMIPIPPKGALLEDYEQGKRVLYFYYYY